MRVTHFYHVFADGSWEIPAEEHFKNLISSELIRKIDNIFLGIVGAETNRDKVKRKIPGIVVAEAETGWEQVTLEKLYEFSKLDNGAIFYAHTKGAWSRSELAKRWRVSMTHDTVTRWRECLTALESFDATGPYWIKSPAEEHKEHHHFFAGNFWWARSDYIRQLEPVRMDTRFRAEGWIGLGNPRVRVLREGQPYGTNFWKSNES